MTAHQATPTRLALDRDVVAAVENEAKRSGRLLVVVIAELLRAELPRAIAEAVRHRLEEALRGTVVDREGREAGSHLTREIDVSRADQENVP
jgi:hypothetical protein